MDHRPVTQVAEVAVKNASIKGVISPLFDEIGRVRRRAPARDNQKESA